MRSKVSSNSHVWCRQLLVLLSLVTSTTAYAWVYPEHRDIALLAVKGLDGEYQAEFDRMWQAARAGDETRLCANGADDAQGLAPTCIDWAALSAIAGDHSCSGSELLDTVRTSAWILVVAKVAAKLKADLAAIPQAPPALSEEGLKAETRRLIEIERNRAAHANALRTADARLIRADTQYATRADANLAHFLLPRPDTNLDTQAYGNLTLTSGSPVNALGVYTWYHIRALQKARHLATDRLTAAEREAWSRAALFDEAFALHFLEDVFASGHVAGSWGDVAQRKGTHDFYNENGLEVFTWNNHTRTVVLLGDAHMRPQDAEFAAHSIRDSLVQVLDAANGRAGELPDAAVSPFPETFDVCTHETFPELGLTASDRQAYIAAFGETLRGTPIPALGAGLGALPRARSEIGKFVGVSGSIDGRWTNSSFVPSQNSGGGIGGIDIAFRAGYGLEGALRNAGDGLIFGELGVRADSPSTNHATGTALANLTGTLNAAIPARYGLSLRMRMPFYVVPFDLLLLSPLYFANEPAYTKLAVTAANGGLIPWQQGWATPIGRFQFVLGREIGVVVFSPFGNDNELAAPGAGPDGAARVVRYGAVLVELPILEYRPYRSFSSKQSSTLVFQVFAGLDIPYDEHIETPPGAPPVNLQTIYSLGVRMSFDWRYYP